MESTVICPKSYIDRLRDALRDALERDDVEGDEAARDYARVIASMEEPLELDFSEFEPVTRRVDVLKPSPGA